MKPSTLFSPEQQQAIVTAIRKAEQSSSVEIRIHVENHCPGTVLDRAVVVFDELGMRQTAGRNGVLVYVALKDHLSAIIGDENVNCYVHKEFWEECQTAMTTRFVQGAFADGITAVIGLLEEELKTHFPIAPDDRNELPDQISFGE